MGILSAIGTAAGALFGGPSGAAIGAGIGSGLDSWTSGRDSSAAQVATNEANAGQAQLNRDFQAEQSSTAYQRAVKDMQAAGLNPMLAYSNGGASTPTGSTAVMSNPALAGASAEQASASGSAASSSSSANYASAGEANARTELAKRTADKVVQEVVNLKTDNDKAQAVIANLYKEGENLVKQGWNLTDVGNQLRASVRLMGLQSEQVGALVRTTEWDSQLREAQTKLTNLDVSAAQSMGNIGREAGQLKPLFDLLRVILRR